MEREEEIKRMAYSFWEERGRLQGRDLEDYYRAEKIYGEQQEQAASVRAPDQPSRAGELTGSHLQANGNAGGSTTLRSLAKRAKRIGRGAGHQE